MLTTKAADCFNIIRNEVEFKYAKLMKCLELLDEMVDDSISTLGKLSIMTHVFVSTKLQKEVLGSEESRNILSIHIARTIFLLEAVDSSITSPKFKLHSTMDSNKSIFIDCEMCSAISIHE
jgi:hypothetical protein